MELLKEKCDQMNPPKYEKCQDMASLTYLNEASVLHNLAARYEIGLIYVSFEFAFCIPWIRLIRAFPGFSILQSLSA